jgi:hypothetical protein
MRADIGFVTAGFFCIISVGDLGVLGGVDDACPFDDFWAAMVCSMMAAETIKKQNPVNRTHRKLVFTWLISLDMVLQV